MKLFSTIALILIFNIKGFSQNNTDSLMNAFTPEKKSAKIFNQKAIQFNSNDTINPDYELKEGKKLLFEYEFRSKEYLQIADDEIVERLIFTINPKANSFYFSSTNLKNIPILYTQSCFCRDAGTYKIKNGTFIGKKVNSTTWKVKIKFSYIARNSNLVVKKAFSLTYKIAKNND
jgi:hypothetical protein